MKRKFAQIKPTLLIALSILSLGTFPYYAEASGGCLGPGGAENAAQVFSPKGSEGPLLSTAKIEKPLLYAIEHNGRRSFIMGTAHKAVSIEEMPDYVLGALRRSRVFATEANPAELGEIQRRDPVRFHQMTSMSADQGKLSDSAHLGKALFKKLRKEIQSVLGGGLRGWKARRSPDNPLHENAIDRFTPAYALQQITSIQFVQSVIKELGAEKASELFRICLDRMLEEATAPGTSIEYLETAQDQFRALDKTITIEDLRIAVEEFNQKRKGSEHPSPLLPLRELVTIYRSGDLKALEAMIQEANEFPALLIARNQAWIPKIMDMHTRGQAFVAFGAGHLTGPQGVIELLKQQGFKVTRVTNAQEAEPMEPMKLPYAPPEKPFNEPAIHWEKPGYGLERLQPGYKPTTPVERAEESRHRWDDWDNLGGW